MQESQPAVVGRTALIIRITTTPRIDAGGQWQPGCESKLGGERLMSKQQYSLCSGEADQLGKLVLGKAV